MAELLCNDVPVVTARVVLPRRGAWHADLVLDAQELPESPAILAASDGTPVLVGAVQRGAARSGRVEVRVIGGAGGLGRALGPKFYRSPTVQLILQDLATEAGESLSASIHADVLQTVLPAWTRKADLASHCFAGIARALGLTWRVLADGTLWVGAETWPAVEVEHELLGDHVALASAEIATDTLAPELVPGITFRDRRVSFVQHDVQPDRMRTRLLFERASTDLEPAGVTDSATGPLEGLIRQVTQRTAYHALWAGRVVAQREDRTLDVVLDRADMPGLTSVPLLSFSPGVQVTVPDGARVAVSFLDGDPQRPVATLCEPDSADLEQIKLGAGATKGAVRVDDPTVNGSLTFVGAGNKLTITYTPPGGTPQITEITFLASAAVTVNLVSGGTAALEGKNSAGSSKTLIA